MTGPVRSAGHGTFAGATVTWTMAEGRRGRRWREVVTRDERMAHSLLLETDPDGQFSHLELAVPRALLTLHPEGDGTMHGNRVEAGGTGVGHLVGLPFGPDGLVLLEGSPVAAAALILALGDAVASEGSVRRPAVIVDGAARVHPDRSILVERRSTTAWHIGAGEGLDLEIDDRGLPILDRAAIWPLEV